VICPNDPGVLKECFENGLSIGVQRCASPDHFCYGGAGSPPPGAFVIEADSRGSSYCLACGDESRRVEHAENVASRERARAEAGQSRRRGPVCSRPRARLSALAC